MKNKIFSILFFFSACLTKGQFTKLIDFSGNVNGYGPGGSFVTDGSFLYGMTGQGGTSNLGTLFKIKPDGTAYTKLLDFSGLNGSTPCASLVFEGTFLYGMTANGGALGYGVLFKIKSDGTGYSKLFDFSGVNGSNPLGNLISDGIFLYGMTDAGGISGNGVIFKIKLDGTGYVKLFDFTNISGSGAVGSLFFDGIFLYGMTSSGGIAGAGCVSGCGVIFKIKTDGTGFTKLFDFSNSIGNTPYGSLIFDGTFFYGMARHGGANTNCWGGGCGVIFKIKPDGTGYSKLFDFSGLSDGGNPYGSLIFDGIFFYGMTAFGGTINKGTIFKIKPDGTGYSKLFNFTGTTTGSFPTGDLIFDGAFLYGMTFYGGTNNMGVIFKYQFSATGIKENKSQNDFSVYPNPSSGIIAVNLKTIVETKICVYDLLGNCVFEKVSERNNREIDLSGQPKGIYSMEIMSEGERVVKKIVLQ